MDDLDMQPVRTAGQNIQDRTRQQSNQVSENYDAGYKKGRTSFNKQGFGMGASLPLWRYGGSSNSSSTIVG